MVLQLLYFVYFFAKNIYFVFLVLFLYASAMDKPMQKPASLEQKKNLQHTNAGDGVQFPVPYSDADSVLRIAQRSGNVKETELQNITKGNKLEEDAGGKVQQSISLSLGEHCVHSFVTSASQCKYIFILLYSILLSDMGRTTNGHCPFL